MAGTGNANKSVLVEIKSAADLQKWSIGLGDDFRKMCDDMQLVEMQLNGRLRAIRVIEGSASQKARAVTYQLKLARSLTWAARKAILGVYKKFLREFAAELDAVNGPKKKQDALDLTTA